MWIALLVLGLWGPLIALWGRWARVATWLAAGLTCLEVALVAPIVLLGAPLLTIAGWIDAIRVMRRGRPDRWHPIAAVLVLVAPIAPVLLLRAYVFQALTTPSASMAPTLAYGDHCLADRLSLRWRAPARGDVIVFDAPDGRTFVKRVVAIAGDVIAVVNGTAVVNGVPAGVTSLGPTTYWNVDERTGKGGALPATLWEEALGDRRYRVLHPQSLQDTGDFPGRLWRCETALPTQMPDVERIPDGWPTLAAAAGGCRVPGGAVFVLGDNRDDSSDSRVWGAVPLARVTGRVTAIWMPAGEPSRDWGRIGRID